MSSEQPERLMADGMSDWWRSSEGREKRRKIEVEVRSRFRERLEAARWHQRLLSEWRVRREIKREIEKVTLEVLWIRE